MSSVGGIAPSVLQTLEFPAALDLVAGHAAGPLGAARVRSRTPATDPATIRDALAQVAELAGFLLTDDTLRAAGHARPRIGVAALNPHNGENGLFGDEEIRIIRPTVETLRAEGVNCTGPISSDVIFIKATRGEFDGVVMMYHDQGQIATKLLGFNKGVTVTAGLKTVFTTPAHGTAYDIVGQGRADPGALEHAFTLAAKLAAHSKFKPRHNSRSTS